MTHEVSITGGAGPQETAAILAAVARVLQDEAAAAAPTGPPRQSPWVSAWRPRELLAPASGNHAYADWWSESFTSG